MVSVPEKKWYPLAKSLKENKDLDFDVLSAVVGMDWKETIGVVYYFTSTSRNWGMLVVKVEAESRDDAYIHSVSDPGKLPISRNVRFTICSVSNL